MQPILRCAVAALLGLLGFAPAVSLAATRAASPTRQASATIPPLLGDQALESSGDYVDAGTSEAFRFTASASGTATSISVYTAAGTAASTLRAAVYSNAGSHPGSLITAGYKSNPVLGAWNSVPVTAATITAGTSYWIAVLGNSGTLWFRDRASGPCASETSAGSISSFPSSWHTGVVYSDCPISAYVSGTSGTPPPPPPPPPPPAPPANTSLPTVSTSAVQGTMANASTGAWNPNPTAYSYQWQDCDTSGATCSNRGGSTLSSLMLASSDVGHRMRVVVTASDAGGSGAATSAASPVVAAPAVAAPTNTAPPTVSGTPTQGQTLTGGQGTWTGNPTAYTYQWQTCTASGTGCVAIAGATSASYVLTAAEVGHTVRLVVVASNSGGSASMASATTAVVAGPAPPPAPTNSVLPTVSGNPTQGQVLTGTSGTWTGSPAYAYQWQQCDSSAANCVPVSGASSSSYTLAAGDVSHTMRLTVTATNGGGSATATSAPTAQVAAAVTPPPTTCTTTVSSSSAASSAAAAAAGGSVICLTAGSYPSISLSGTHSSDVAIEAATGARVTVAGFQISGAYYLVRNFYITNEVNVLPGSSHITIDHNDITGGGEGINGGSVDCAAPHAPQYSGCTSSAPISYLTISGNHFHDFGIGTEDAIHLNNWQHVRVTANEFNALTENGNHTDAFQSVWGGSDIVFDHNYEHDNQSQGFFISNGDVVNATVSDNLMVRGNTLGLGEVQIQIGDTHNVVIDHNTVWADGGTSSARSWDTQPTSCGGDPYCSATPYNAQANHNVLERLDNNCSSCGDPAPVPLTESNNLFQQSPFTFGMSSSDIVNTSPAFVDPAHDDYRLASNPNGLGVDWRPADQTYGPTP